MKHGWLDNSQFVDDFPIKHHLLIQSVDWDLPASPFEDARNWFFRIKIWCASPIISLITGFPLSSWAAATFPKEMLASLGSLPWCQVYLKSFCHILWEGNIAIETGTFLDDFPIDIVPFHSSWAHFTVVQLRRRSRGVPRPLQGLCERSDSKVFVWS